VEKVKISKATLSRLPYYLQFLKESSSQEMPMISATKIALSLSLGEVQVRKDLSAVCGKGKPKLGYRTSELLKSIETCLGCSNFTPAVLVGAGKLGRALLEYDEFEKYGVRITAAFDNNDRVIQYRRSLEVLPMTQFESYCRENSVRIGIITVGEGSAQTVCDRMIDSGITAIWNFAPCTLKIPDGILFRQENLALSLAYLNSQLWSQKKEGEQTVK
jgi:redox-sensing transcriptional repressor